MPLTSRPKDPPSLATLSLSPSPTPKPATTSRPRKSVSPPLNPAPPPDSWEEDAEAYDSPPSSPHRPLPSADLPPAPPPTPISPTKPSAWTSPYGPPHDPLPPPEKTKDRRPETSTSAAARMIAAGLGVRQPKRSEEARAYEKAVRGKVEREREAERERVEREEKERVERVRGVWEG